MKAKNFVVQSSLEPCEFRRTHTHAHWFDWEGDESIKQPIRWFVSNRPRILYYVTITIKIAGQDKTGEVPAPVPTPTGELNQVRCLACTALHCFIWGGGLCREAWDAILFNSCRLSLSTTSSILLHCCYPSPSRHLGMFCGKQLLEWKLSSLIGLGRAACHYFFFFFLYGQYQYQWAHLSFQTTVEYDWLHNLSISIIMEAYIVIITRGWQHAWMALTIFLPWIWMRILLVSVGQHRHCKIFTLEHGHASLCLWRGLPLLHTVTSISSYHSVRGRSSSFFEENHF